MRSTKGLDGLLRFWAIMSYDVKVFLHAAYAIIRPGFGDLGESALPPNAKKMLFFFFFKERLASISPLTITPLDFELILSFH